MSISKKLIVFVIFLTFWGTSSSLWATVLSVPSQYTNIQAAIDAAAQFGDVIEVADGTYTGTGNKNLVVDKKLVTIKSQGGPENCIIDCENDGRGFSFYNVGAYAELDGFKIQNASSGAIYCNTASPTIKNCNFLTNSGSNGGGIDCRVSSPTIQNCRFESNSASSNGGALYCNDRSSPIVLNCTFTSNSASDGGAIYCASSSHPQVNNCVIIANSSGNGGAIYSTINCHPKIYNSSIILNSAGQGAVVYLAYASWSVTHASFQNCIFWDNSNNTTFSHSDHGGNNLYISYSNVQIEYNGTGNISQDPLFISKFDPHLSPNSPCIDAGTPIQGIETDFDGNVRVQGRSIDMGAFEFVFENPVGDLNEDKKVYLNDAILIIQSIHGNAPDINVANADFTDDNAVNIFDAVKLIQYIVKNIDAL